MQIPHFPESQHSIVQSLFHHTDQDLLLLFQRYPEAGRYFVTIFCRYNTIVYTLIQHAVRSPVQADYLFAITWRHIYYELSGLELSPLDAVTNPREQPKNSAFNLQAWLINITAVCVNHAKLPPVESIHYTLAEASPPLWCYLEQALSQLSPLHRLTVLMAQTFHWNPTRIAAYLRAEGTVLSEEEVDQVLEQGYQNLYAVLPDDICQIYHVRDHSSQSANQAAQILKPSATTASNNSKHSTAA